MSIEKSQIKILVSQNLGKDLEQTKEELEQRLFQKKGGTEALKFAAKRIAELNEITEEEFKDGKYDEILKDPLELTKFVKRKITQAVHSVDNLATNAEVAFYKIQGEIDGVNKAILKVKKIYDEEHGKLRKIQAALEEQRAIENEGDIEKNSDDSTARSNPPLTGVHPGLTLKQKRLREEALKQKEDKKEQKKEKKISQKRVGKKSTKKKTKNESKNKK